MIHQNSLSFLTIWIIVMRSCLLPQMTLADDSCFILSALSFKHYIDGFNQNDEELYTQLITNDKAWDFLTANIPFFECPDKFIEKTYYFRWWTYRKHIKYINPLSPLNSCKCDRFVITEFLPHVPWSGLNNTISCAAGHHFREGRWLHNSTYLNSYAKFWAKDGNPRGYSFWFADSIRALSMVTGDNQLLKDLLPPLINNFEALRVTNLQPTELGMYMNTDNRDGMEMSIGGAEVKGSPRGIRPTLNSYQYAEAIALSKIIQSIDGDPQQAKLYQAEAKRLKRLVEEKLWDPNAKYFKVMPVKSSVLVDVRELHGYTPWYFNLPEPDKLEAWKQLMDPKGFYAPFGLTTAEQRHPKFKIDYDSHHECLWNGPTWPYATSITLTALANVLNNNVQSYVSKEDYYHLLQQYARSHTRFDEIKGINVSWIDENINPYTGDWISRTLLKQWENGTWSAKKGGKERGKDYNHSTFCDLVISGLVGLRPREKNVLVISPLVPPGMWSYFCLDRVLYHGRYITIVWDETGQRYGRGAGLTVFVDGKPVASAKTLTRLRVQLPEV